MRHFTRITLALLAVAALASPSLAYTVSAGHPRLFFTAAELPALRARCGGALASDYADLKGYCDQHIGDSLPLASVDYYEYQLAAYGFVWLMSQDPTYAARAKSIATHAMDNAGLTGDPTYTRALAYFFDWCYGYLSQPERQVFGAELAQSGRQWNSRFDWDILNNYHSKISEIRHLAYIGIPLYDEGIDDVLATQLCDTFHDNMYDPSDLIACVDEIGGDGGYFEGHYNEIIWSGDFLEGCWMWAVATDEDPFDTCTNLSHIGDYYAYEVYARSGSSVGANMRGSKQGDSKTHTIDDATVRLALHAVASKYSDPHAQWLAREIVRVGSGSIYRPDLWKLIVFCDPAVPEEPPAAMPLAHWFHDMGLFYVRSGWDYSAASTDVYAVLRCEPLNSFHTHAHQGHFLIARGNDLLAIDSGVYHFDPHHYNYFERTVAHNSITIFDPNETTFGPYANDGGQIPPLEEYPLHYGEASAPPYYRGEIVSASYDPDLGFAYVKCDLTAAYASYKVRSVTREFCWIRPDTFIILDRVASTSPSYQQRWLLHSISEPSIDGDTVTIEEGASKMFVRTVLPEAHTTTKIGGPGHEFEVNGVNYPPAIAVPDDAGAWRIEVSPTEDAAEQVFLHVINVAPSSAQEMPEVDYSESDEMFGVRVDGFVVRFSKSGESDVTLESYQY